MLLRLRGMLAPDDEMDEQFGAALSATDPQPFVNARTLLAYGERLRRARRRRDAREQLASALDAFELLGARLFAERARDELAAAGVRDTAPEDGDPWSKLTPAERRVVEAIINGATYSEAA